MTRTKEDKKRIIELLRESPLIGIACRQVGISRATFYRWREARGFDDAVKAALREGRGKWSDLGEVMLIKRVKEGNMDAIRYLLGHNSRRYALKSASKVVTVPCQRPHEESLTPEQMTAIQRAARNSGLLRNHEED